MNCRRTRLPGLALIALTIVIAFPFPGRADEPTGTTTTASDDFPRLEGPLRIRDLFPLSILLMEFYPANTAHLAAGHLRLEAQLDYSNSFGMSKNVLEYLQKRNRREPLSDSDVAAILALPGDAFYFDATVTMLNVGAQYAICDRCQVYLNVPFLSYSGGSLDSTIEHFHSAFGLGQEGRELVARNQLQLAVKFGNHSLAADGSQLGSGLGDPVVGFRYAINSSPGFDVVGEAAAKIPVGDTSRFLSTGSPDYGLQVSVQRRYARNGLYFSASYVWLGKADFLPNLPLGGLPAATLAYEHLFGEHWAAIGQASWSRSSFIRNTVEEIAAPKKEVAVGARYQRNGKSVTLALIENVGTFNNTPDIGIHLGTSFLLK
ncbi:MAG TPA: DUF3187 family protein [Thermoanaerobaculia bacterium]